MLGLQLTLSSISVAGGWAATEGNSVKVTGIYTLSETRAIVKLSSFAYAHGCKTNSNGDVFLDPSLNKSWYSALLTAYVSGKPVNVYVGDLCVPIWAGTSYASIGHVRLQ